MKGTIMTKSREQMTKAELLNLLTQLEHDYDDEVLALSEDNKELVSTAYEMSLKALDLAKKLKATESSIIVNFMDSGGKLMLLTVDDPRIAKSLLFQLRQEYAHDHVMVGVSSVKDLNEEGGDN